MHLKRWSSENSVTDTLSVADAARFLHEAAQLNREDPIRRGSTLHFGASGQLVMTGDMHGNQRNFDKLQRYCALRTSPSRYVILHELIHSEPERFNDPDFSIDLLIRAVRWKCEFPDNVFFLQSNHELSQLCSHEIVKGGRSVLHDFESGIAKRFGSSSIGKILDGVLDYIASLPLAARTASGIFLSHSLPSAGFMDFFDASVLDRVPTTADLNPGGSAHALVWGRFQPAEALDRFAARLGVKLFIVGHTPQETGFNVIGRLIILASDHAHGVFLPIDLSRDYTTEDLASSIRKFAGVA